MSNISAFGKSIQLHIVDLTFCEKKINERWDVKLLNSGIYFDDVGPSSNKRSALKLKKRNKNIYSTKTTNLWIERTSSSHIFS